MRIGSTFDILGPIMVGPSSSHTAGALRLSHLATSLCPAPVKEVGFVLYNSFATTFAATEPTAPSSPASSAWTPTTPASATRSR